MRNINGILQLTSLVVTAVALALLVYCLGRGQDLLAIYWGAVVVVALRFGLVTPELEQ